MLMLTLMLMLMLMQVWLNANDEVAPVHHPRDLRRHPDRQRIVGLDGRIAIRRPDDGRT